MHKDQTYMTQAGRLSETVLRELPPKSHLIMTGQIGCGNTTLARKISIRLSMVYLPIDDYPDDADPESSASRTVSSIDSGWVAEANVWQIPDAI